MGKTVNFELGERDLFNLFVHFVENVVANTAREQDEYEEIWQSLHFDDIKARVAELGDNASSVDFSETVTRACELTRDEIVFFIKFLSRPCKGVLSRDIRRVRHLVTDLRDKKNVLRAAPDPSPDESPDATAAAS